MKRLQLLLLNGSLQQRRKNDTWWNRMKARAFPFIRR